MRIAGKRQVTLPERLLQVMGLKEGDEFVVEASEENGVRSFQMIPYKSVRADIFTPEVRAMLAERIKEREAGMPMFEFSNVDEMFAALAAMKEAEKQVPIAVKVEKAKKQADKPSPGVLRRATAQNKSYVGG